MFFEIVEFARPVFWVVRVRPWKQRKAEIDEEQVGGEGAAVAGGKADVGRRNEESEGVARRKRFGGVQRGDGGVCV